MAKRKDLLLTEATTMRMMGLAGIGSLANPFLRESYMEEGKCSCGGKMNKGVCESCGSMKEGEETYYEQEMEENMLGHLGSYEDEEQESTDGVDKEAARQAIEDLESAIGLDDEEDFDDQDDEEEYDDEEDDEEEYDDEEEDLEEYGLVRNVGGSGSRQTPSQMRKFGNIKNKKNKDGSKESSEKEIKESMKRLKRLLEQADAPPPPTTDEEDEAPLPEPPPASEGASGDEMQSKIKEFVKKLGELVQETLGVQVTVEEEGEEKGPEAPEGEAAPPPPTGAIAGTAPEGAMPMQEAINRLVNKVARRVKARLMEAKKDPKAAAMKAKKMKMMKEKQAADKKKEAEAAAKKKKMEMIKKKAAKKK